jgi:hypothetical protein
MSRKPQEFLNFIASHYRTIAEIYRDDLRFDSDDEIVSFLSRFDETGKDQTKLAGRLKEVGVLQEMLGRWAPTTFVPWRKKPLPWFLKKSRNFKLTSALLAQRQQLGESSMHFIWLV